MITLIPYTHIVLSGKRMKFTKHARDRLKRSNITEQEAKTLLNQSYLVKKVRNRVIFANGVNEFVCTIENDSVVIITYYDKRADLKNIPLRSLIKIKQEKSVHVKKERDESTGFCKWCGKRKVTCTCTFINNEL